MARKKIQVKVKEPVRLRLKELANGNYSIYLDIYSNGVRSYEFLRLYLVPEQTEADRRANEETMRTANSVKVRRTMELLTGKPCGDTEQRRMLVEDYLARYKVECERNHRGDSYVKMCMNMEYHLRAFLGQRMTTLRMKEIDARMCRRFAEFLGTAKMSTGKPLSKVSVYHYFSAFRNMMSEAVKDGVIVVDPTKQLKKVEVPRRPEVTKDFLDADDVVALGETACGHESVKRAFMFCCFTGLRYSDVSRLKWSDIRRWGDGWRLTMIMQKTQEPIQCKLSDEAVWWLPEHGEGTELVFQLPSKSCVDRTISKWAAAAGIDKHVTFHTSRHSYATMALTAGADLYTISKLLGHRNITTTTMYAAVVDAQRDAAIDGVSELVRKRRKKRE